MEDNIKETEDWENIKRQPVSRSLLYFLPSLHKPQVSDLQESFEKAGIPPNSEYSLIWLSRFLGGLGVSLLLSGIMFFFAYNWADLHKFVKIGLGWGALLLAGAFTLAKPKDSFSFKLGLTAQTILTGILLALIGQIYQTGANAYDFFLAWSILSLFWVISSQFPPLWLFYLVLINTTVILYAIQVQLIASEGRLMLVLTVLNGISLALWEWNKLKNNQNKKLFAPRWIPQVIALAVYISLGISSMVFLYEPTLERGITFFLFIGLIAGSWRFYQNQTRDILFLSYATLAGIIWINNLLIWMLSRQGRDVSTLLFFLCSVITILLTIIGVKKLVKINTQWKKDEIKSYQANII